MDPRTKDALKRAAASAQKDAEPDDQAAGRRNGVARRTANHHTHVGHPDVVAFFEYLHRCADPLRVAEEGVSVAKMLTVARLSTVDAIARYHAILEHECQVEADDRRLDVTRGISWADRAQASSRDAAVNEEKSALERLFDARGVSEEAVFGLPGRVH